MADIMKMGKNPNYLGSWDLEELPSRELTLTIAQVKDESVVGSEGRESVCTVCYWQEPGYKPMILNVSNKKAIVKLYKTKDTDKLKGKAVVIGIEKVKAFGGVHDALRIRPRIPAAPSLSLPKCENCGKDIQAYGSMTPAQVAAYRKDRYKKALCNECAKAAAEGAKK